MSDTTVTLQAARDKWCAHWPEWEIAELFVPANTREMAWVWFAWLDELAMAAWSGEDATPGLAKLAWWQEELRGWAKGARRHPLSSVLQPLNVDWGSIANEMGALRERDAGISGDIDAVARTLDGFARSVAMAEHTVFGGTFAVQPERLLRTMMISAGRVPNATLGEGNAHGPRARRLLDAVADRRVTASNGKVGRFSVLWASWRAARSG